MLGLRSRVLDEVYSYPIRGVMALRFSGTLFADKSGLDKRYCGREYSVSPVGFYGG